MPTTNVILRGTGTPPQGYVGPFHDEELGSYFRRYEAVRVPKRPGDYVASARIAEGRVVPVLSCGCDAGSHDGRDFYTSVRREDGRHVAISGPYRHHATALDEVADDRAWAQERDPRAVWYAFGTMSVARGASVRTARS